VIHLSDTTPESRLTLYIAGYDRWQATQNAKPLAIRPAPARGAEYPFLMEMAVRDGDLVLRYVRRAVDWLGLVASVTGLLLLGFGLLAKRPSWIGVGETWLDRHSARLRRAFAAVVVAGAVVAIVRLSWARNQLPSTSLFHQRPQLTLAGQSCEPVGPQTWQCGGYRMRARANNGMYGNHYCVEASASPLVLTLHGFTGDAVYGRYDSNTWYPSGHIQVDLGDQRVGEALVRGVRHGLQFLMFDLRRYAKPEGQTLRIEVSDFALHCFDLGTAL
jgi:hypothetical protein